MSHHRRRNYDEEEANRYEDHNNDNPEPGYDRYGDKIKPRVYGKGTGWGKQGDHYTGDSDGEEVDEYGNKIEKHGSLKAGIKGALVGTIGGAILGGATGVGVQKIRNVMEEKEYNEKHGIDKDDDRDDRRDRDRDRSRDRDRDRRSRDDSRDNDRRRDDSRDKDRRRDDSRDRDRRRDRS